MIKAATKTVLERLDGPVLHLIAEWIRVPDVCAIVVEYMYQFKNAIVHQLKGHTSTVMDLIVLNDNMIASCSTDTIRIWDITSGECLRVLLDVQTSALALCDEHHLAAATQRNVKVWNFDTGMCVHTLIGHIDTVNKVVSIGGGQLVSCAANVFKIWDIETGRCLHTEYDNSHLVSLAHVGDILMILSTEDWLSERALCSWSLQAKNDDDDWAESEDVSVIAEWVVRYRAFVKISNNQILWGAVDGSIHLWDVRGRLSTQIKTINTGGPEIKSMAFRPPNLIFVRHADGLLRILTLDGEQVSAFPSSAYGILALPNGLHAELQYYQNDIYLMV